MAESGSSTSISASTKVFPWWSGLATMKPWLARCAAKKNDWKRMPPLPWEKSTRGKVPGAIAASRKAGVVARSMPITRTTSIGSPATAASVEG